MVASVTTPVINNKWLLGLFQRNRFICGFFLSIRFFIYNDSELSHFHPVKPHDQLSFDFRVTLAVKTKNHLILIRKNILQQFATCPLSCHLNSSFFIGKECGWERAEMGSLNAKIMAFISPTINNSWLLYVCLSDLIYTTVPLSLLAPKSARCKLIKNYELGINQIKWQYTYWKRKQKLK